jgi:hypothetical protein
MLQKLQRNRFVSVRGSMCALRIGTMTSKEVVDRFVLRHVNRIWLVCKWCKWCKWVP